jgi:hypothetical protein
VETFLCAAYAALSSETAPDTEKKLNVSARETKVTWKRLIS